MSILPRNISKYNKLFCCALVLIVLALFSCLHKCRLPGDHENGFLRYIYIVTKKQALPERFRRQEERYVRSDFRGYYW